MRVLEDRYEGFKKLVGFLGTKAEHHVIADGLGGHMEPLPDGTSSFAPKRTPAVITSTAHYYYSTLIVPWS